MAIRISGTTGIDMGNTSVSNCSQVEVQEEQVSPFSGFKNYIINGNFDVWQRGGSQTTSGYGSDDRWSNDNLGSTKTHSLVACGDNERVLFNAAYFSRTVVTSIIGINNGVTKFQNIEDVTKLAGKTVTLSFWARADSEKSIAVYLLQIFGTGGSPSSVVKDIGTQLVTLSTSWQKKVITINIPNIVGKTIGTNGRHTSYTQVAFGLESGSVPNSTYFNSLVLGQQSGTFDIAQVQLEEGSVATAFENRPVGLELSLCQRYFYNHGAKEGRHLPYAHEATGATGISAAGTMAYRLSQDHPSPMRATPTVSYSGTIFLWNGPTEINVISIALNNSNATTRSIDYNVASAFSGAFQPVKEFLTQGSFLNVSAEL